MIKPTFARALCASLCLLAIPLHAQDAAHKPITIVVPYPAGGTADMLPRMAAERLPAILGQPVVVLNKPGAAGSVGAEFVAHSPADGLTLLVVPPHFFVSDMLYKVSFAPRTFVPVSILATYPNVLLVGPKLASKDLNSFIATAKSASPPLTGASPGAGTSQHLSAELLKSLAKVDYTHIPYKGSAPAISDLMGGHVDFMFDNLITAQPLIQSGRLTLVGVGSTKRNKLFPNVPAIAEVAPGFESVTWMGIVAPPGTPQAVVDKLSRAFAQAIKTPATSKQIEDLQAEPVGSSSAEMAETVRADVARWTSVIKAGNITAE